MTTQIDENAIVMTNWDGGKTVIKNGRVVYQDYDCMAEMNRFTIQKCDNPKEDEKSE